jgi:geranylgeranyl pyrophosphate synthase
VPETSETTPAPTPLELRARAANDRAQAQIDELVADARAREATKQFLRSVKELAAEALAAAGPLAAEALKAAVMGLIERELPKHVRDLGR